MKGIILAGGTGTRLHPLTIAVSKQLLPVYDKPMVYYPLSVLMLAGIREVLVISTPHDTPMFKRLLGNGEQLGMLIDYAVQPEPEGLAQGFIIGREFLHGGPACLILGDNIFYGEDFSPRLRKSAALVSGARIFAYPVRDPERYGVVEIEKGSECAVSLEEKPPRPRSNLAVPGLYFYDKNVCDYACSLTPSARGELEITDLNRVYMRRRELNVQRLGRGFAWLDTGTHRSLVEATNFVETIERRQGLKIACLEEIALRNGWIGEAEVAAAALRMEKSPYGAYLQQLLTAEWLGEQGDLLNTLAPINNQISR